LGYGKNQQYMNKINSDHKFEWADYELKEFMDNIDTLDVEKMTNEQRDFWEKRIKVDDEYTQAMFEIHKSGVWRDLFKHTL